MFLIRSFKDGVVCVAKLLLCLVALIKLPLVAAGSVQMVVLHCGRIGADMFSCGSSLPLQFQARTDKGKRKKGDDGGRNEKRQRTSKARNQYD